MQVNEHGDANNFVQWRDVTLTEVPADTPASALAPPVDRSCRRSPGGDQRHVLDVPVGTPYSWSTEADQGQHQPTVRALGTFAQRVDRRRAAAGIRLARRRPEADPSAARDEVCNGDRHDARRSAQARRHVVSGDQCLGLEQRGNGNRPRPAHSPGTDTATQPATRTRITPTRETSPSIWIMVCGTPARFVSTPRPARIASSLREPWSGPQIAAGAAIRNASSGRLFNQPEAELPFNTKQSIVGRITLRLLVAANGRMASRTI